MACWQSSSAGWTLRQNTNPAVSGWVNSTETINVVSDKNQITVTPPARNRFYRLFKP